MSPILINAAEHPDACGRHNACRCEVGSYVQVLVFAGLHEAAVGGGEIRVPCWVRITAVDRPPLPAAIVAGTEPSAPQVARIRYTGQADDADAGSLYLPAEPFQFYPDNVFQVG